MIAIVSVSPEQGMSSTSRFRIWRSETWRSCCPVPTFTIILISPSHNNLFRHVDLSFTLYWFIFMYFYICEFCQNLNVHPATHAGRPATLTISLSLSLFCFFFVFPFHPNQLRQMTTLWRLVLPQVSSYRGVFPGRCHTILALEGSVGFLLIVLSASRHL